MSETITIGDIEVDAQDALEAAQKFEESDAPLRNRTTRHDSVILASDGDNDHAVYVINAFKGRASGFYYVNDIINAAKESFEDYLRENVFTEGTHTFESDSDRDIAVSEHGGGEGFTVGSGIQNAVQDPNVEVAGIRDGSLLLDDLR